MKTEPKMDAVCATEYSMSGSIRDGLGDGRRFWHLLGQCEMSDVHAAERTESEGTDNYASQANKGQQKQLFKWYSSRQHDL